jgi:hypothetical protein
MSFTDQKPRVATEAEVNAPWSGNKKNFRCAFCGHRFKVGDVWRWLFTNDMPSYGGNPLVCESCDDETEALREKWKAKCDEFTGDRAWWFFRNLKES